MNTTESVIAGNLAVSLQASFDAHSIQLQQNNASLLSIKSSAFERFLKKGFPSKKIEDYKYFPLDALNKSDIQPIYSYKSIQVSESSETAFPVIELTNGVEINAKNLRKTGLLVNSFKSLSIEKQEKVLQNIDGRTLENDSLFQLNQAFFSELLYIETQPDTEAEIKLVHILEGNEHGNWIFPKVLVLAAENSKLTITEEFKGEAESSICVNTVHVVCEKQAHVKWHKIQQHNGLSLLVDNTLASVKQHGNFEVFTACIEGKKIRNNLAISLDSELCEAHLNGFYFPAAGQIMDNHTSVDHRFARCESNEYYKGVVGNGGQAIFNGKVFVRQDAQKTNAYQSNKNILLGDDAVINTKPQLEIYADDVKCSHGSSTGFIDSDALFYLQSRGISRSSAQSLLLSAFAADVLNKVDNEELLNDLINHVNAKIARINL
jgi:Fe-S cluster assembly protein SufD